MIKQLKRPLTTNNSSSVSASFFSCVALRSPHSFECYTKMALACVRKSFSMAVKDCVSNYR